MNVEFRSLGARRLVIGLGVLLVLSLLQVGIQPASATPARPKVGQSPKESLARYSMRMLDGEEYTLQELRGQVVVVNFFATWCRYSKQHIEALTRLDRNERGRGVQVLGLSVQDRESAPETLRKLIREYRIDYPIGIVTDQVFVQFVESIDVSVPQTLVYGRTGRLAAHFHGHDANVEAQLAAAVSAELGRP